MRLVGHFTKRKKTAIRYNSKVIRVEQLKDGLNIAELFHGPTLTFKDLGLTIVAKMYDYFLEKRRRHMTVLVGEALINVDTEFE